MAQISVDDPKLLAGFVGFILLCLVLDLVVFHRKAKEVQFRHAVFLVCFWISLGLAFNGWIYFQFRGEHGHTPAVEFFTAYVLEYSLSVDNLFVFILLFQHFAVPPTVQHRVLFWGILGAIITRGIFIIAGIQLIQAFAWLLYVFGAFLVFTGAKLLFGKKGDEEDVGRNPVVRFFRRHLRVTDQYHGASFFTRIDGKLFATPLLLVLIAVESTDVVFATDSIPAVFGVVTLNKPWTNFVVFTSNIFAILGLRSLYFVLSGFMKKFEYLNVGLGLVLVFIGLKMIVAKWFHPPVYVSLGVIVLCIGGSMVFSAFKKQKPEPSV
jgi:tellurite resistance protein TerC